MLKEKLNVIPVFVHLTFLQETLKQQIYCCERVKLTRGADSESAS